MSDWRSFLKADPTEWLLEKDNPSVRYFILTEILNKPENDPKVKEAKDVIMKIGGVPKILAEQNDEGYWETPKRFYTAKYKGTVWQLIILAELGADGKNERIRKACEFIFENSQDRESSGFSDTSARTGGGRHSGVMPCLTGNMVWSLIRFGYSSFLLFFHFFLPIRDFSVQGFQTGIKCRVVPFAPHLENERLCFFPERLSIIWAKFDDKILRCEVSLDECTE